MLAEKFVSDLERKYSKALEDDNQFMVDKCEILITSFKKLDTEAKLRYFIKKYGT
jgi:hypothetical protein